MIGCWGRRAIPESPLNVTRIKARSEIRLSHLVGICKLKSLVSKSSKECSIIRNTNNSLIFCRDTHFDIQPGASHCFSTITVTESRPLKNVAREYANDLKRTLRTCVYSSKPVNLTINHVFPCEGRSLEYCSCSGY